METFPALVLNLCRWTAAGLVLLRFVNVQVGFAKARRNRETAQVWQQGLAEFAPALELAMLAIAPCVLLWRHPAPIVTPGILASAIVGAVLGMLGTALSLWAVRSLPSISVGHYVLGNQPIVSTGAYGLMRHPIYSSAFLIWFGLALAFQSLAIGLFTALYVIPAYVLYVRAEEKMMLRAYGGAYEEYRARVGGFVPRRWRTIAQSDRPLSRA